MRMKKVFALLLTGMMTVSAPTAVFASSTEEQIADVQAQKDAAQAELAQEQANMASLESKKQELESYLEELNAQYTDLTNSVSELGIQAAEKEDELKTLKAQLEEAKATSDKQYEDMKKRIVYMYENGSASMLELLLSSEDLAQFLNRAENIAQISQYDRDMLANYKALQADIKAQEEQAEEDAQNIDLLLAEKSAKQQEVQALTASTSEDIQAYIYQISASQEEISALNTQIDNADSSIYSLLQAAEAEKAAEEAAAQEASASAEDASDYSESDDYSEDSYEDTEESESSDQSYTEDSESSDSSQTSESESSSSSQGTYLGTFTLTAYCNCAQCCGTAGNLTASGTVPTAGRTVAMAGVPFGTQLLINGTVYTVEDLGTPYGHVDIYCSSHSEALAFGLQSAEVYRLN
ncbi:hypothetical protein LIQ05_05630 [Blautia glucerasea]|uniref:PcsB-like coiled-coil domain-containing protein n=1 Tax=Blautia glucerasea TaxID=536633 RepID=UPI001D02BDF5|nr:hypothetical protein [Blautia glucerasea]MCB5386487.1 hypothetical protein [Blautia glucerasea]MCB5420842.1 hypothetical protein [Blautia luti]